MSILSRPTLIATKNRRGKVQVDGTTSPWSDVIAWHEIKSEDRAIIVVKVPGHKYWSGLGQPWAYAPTQFEVYEAKRQHPPQNDTPYLKTAGYLAFKARAHGEEEPSFPDTLALSVTSLVDVDMRAEPIGPRRRNG